MTPQPKSAWKRLINQNTVPWPIVLLVSLIPLAAAGATVFRAVNQTMNSYATKTGVESTYMHRDSAALTHQRDSMNVTSAITALQKDVSSLVRACQHRGECP